MYWFFVKTVSLFTLEQENLMSQIVAQDDLKLHHLVRNESYGVLFSAQLALSNFTSPYLTRQDENGLIPVVLAASLGKVEVMKCLIDEMSDKNILVPWQKMLTQSVKENNLKVFDALMEVLPKHQLASIVSTDLDSENQTFFHHAATRPEFFKCVLQHAIQNPDAFISVINARDSKKNTPLHLAARCPEVMAVIETVCTYGTPPLFQFYKNADGYTPFLVAVREKNPNLLPFFLRIPTILDNKDEQGNSAFHFSADCPQLLTQLLGKILAPIRGSVHSFSSTPIQHQPNLLGQRPIHLAILSQNTQTIALLMNSFDYAYLDRLTGQTPLQAALATQNEGLIDSVLNHPRLDVGTELSAAIDRNDCNAVRRLLKLHPKQDIYALITRAATVQSEGVEMLSLLYSKMPDDDFNKKDHRTGNTIFHQMVLSGNVKGLRALLDLESKGFFGLLTNRKVAPKPNILGSMPIDCVFLSPNPAEMLSVFITIFPKQVAASKWNGFTLLHRAVISHCDEAVLELCKFQSGKLVNQKSEDGKTPLHLLVESAQVEKIPGTLRSLCEFGKLDYAKTNRDGLTALQYIAMWGKTEACGALLNQNPGLVDQMQANTRFTPLFLAASYKHSGVVSILISKGANLTHRDSQGLTVVEDLFCRISNSDNVFHAFMNYKDVLDQLLSQAQPIPCRSSIFEALVNRLTVDELQNPDIRSALKKCVDQGVVCRNRYLNHAAKKREVAQLFVAQNKRENYTFSIFTLPSTKRRLFDLS
jgi:ankyrin repeat protein